MVSVTREEDNHLSGHVKLRDSQGDISPSKKRKLAKEKRRQKCKSLPAGHFPIIYEDGEFLTVNKSESTLTRTNSLSRLCEKFLEGELIDTHIKELQKYGLVNLLKESNTKAKRPGSYDEQLAAEEGLLRRSSDMGDVIPAQTVDVISETGQSVHQTMKRVSMAFSDISPNFTPEKSPTSSIEDITNDDITEDLTAGDLTTEDLTADEYTTGDLTPDEFTAGDLTPEEDTPGDLSPDDGGTGSPILDEMFNEEKPPVESNTVEGSEYSEDMGKNEDSEPEYKERMENGVTADWNENGTTDNAYNEDSIYECQSNQDRHSTVPSELSSYVSTLSDDSGDEQSDQSWLSSFSGSYQRVFTLKRSYSEENLISKYPFDETRSEGQPSHVASKSYTHFDHAPITRSHSADCSTKPQSSTRPFTFSVTPKKKIVIKDSLWETIKEDTGTNHHEVLGAKDVHTLRRRRKRKSAHKRSKASRTRSTDGRVEGTEHVVRTCTMVNMGDYRQAKNDGKNSAGNSRDLRTKTADHSKDNVMLNSQENVENNCGSTLSDSPEEMNNDHETVASFNSQENIDSNYENTVSNSLEKTENNPPIPPVTKVAVALRKKSPKAKEEKSLFRVDANVSEVPSAINYLCVEAFPSDEPPNSDGPPETSSREVKRTHGNTASKVERLSKYFTKVTSENKKDSGKYNMHKTAETLRKGCSIKKRVEELSKREMYPRTSTKNSEEKLIVEGVDLHSLQNIQDKIGVLRRPSSDDNPTSTNRDQTRSIIELTSSLNHGIPNVQQLKHRLEELDSGHDEHNKKSNDHGISKRTSTSLRIKNRIQELEQNPERKPEQSVDDDLRRCARLKDRIERLQKGAKRAEVDTERDITISDDNDTSQSPKQNEELRTVVIKRGWVQQFVQKIETGS